MKKIKLVLPFAIAILLLNSISIYSQKNDRNWTPKSKERIDMVKKMKLLEKLNLPDDEADKFLTKYTSYEKKIDEKFEALKNATNDLNQSIDKKTNDIKAKADKIISLQEELNGITIEKQKSMKNVLSDENYAKYILFEHTFFRHLNNALMDCKNGKNNFKENKRKRNN